MTQEILLGRVFEYGVWNEAFGRVEPLLDTNLEIKSDVDLFILS